MLVVIPVSLGERAARFLGTSHERRTCRARVGTLLGSASSTSVLLVSLDMDVSSGITSADRARHRSDSTPRLIVADAAVSLVERWKAELLVLRRRSPTSDAAQTLADCVRELVDAINAGQALTVQLTIVEAREVSHIPISTLRLLCKHKPELLGARKRAGVWYIDRAQFERYLSSSAGKAAVPRPAAEPTERPLVLDRALPLDMSERADLSVAAG
jgi:hypothetical protein